MRKYNRTELHRPKVQDDRQYTPSPGGGGGGGDPDNTLMLGGEALTLGGETLTLGRYLLLGTDPIFLDSNRMVL